MVEIVDFSSWKPYEGNAEGSGRSEKQWLISDDGQIGLFKFPKEDPSSGLTTYEHVSEHLAYRIGNLLDVRTAKVDLGRYEGRSGSLSYLIVDEGEMLCEGVQFVVGRHPHYDADQLYDPSTGERYSLKHIFEAVDFEPFRTYWIKMLLFDFLIGNSDRHQSNWAFILSPNRTPEADRVRIEPCPLYDNGSSLCCYIRDDMLRDYLGNDLLRFQSLVDSKSLSLVRIDPYQKKRPRHSDVVRHLLSEYPVTKSMALSFLERLDRASIHSLVNVYQDELVSPDRKELLVRFLQERPIC